MQQFLINGKSVTEYLREFSILGNQAFTQSLHPGVEHVLGVRFSDLRGLAKEIAKSDWKLYLSQVGSYFMEERILHGLVLGYIKPDNDLDEYLSEVTCFVHIINSWSVCDSFSFAGGKAWVHSHSNRLWNYLKEWLYVCEEYEIRFGVVMLMKYFTEEKYLKELLKEFNNVRHPGYYVKMAVAWAISDCFIKFPEYTMSYLNHNDLDDFTYNKSLQKIIESVRVDSSVKQILKLMKRK